MPFSLTGVRSLQDKLDSDYGHIPSEQIAFLAIEPVQGEGGYQFPSAKFMNQIDRFCREHDILIIADEIQSGLGRTGEMWASDYFNFAPDVITSAKALQMGATISRSEIFPDERGRISSTWGAGDIIASMQGVLTVT